MLTPEELKARRRAAIGEAKHSVPVVGIVIGCVVFGGMLYAASQFWHQIQKGPGPVTLRFIEALKREDWPAAKSFASDRSALRVDFFAAAFKAPAVASKIQAFKALTYNVDKVEPSPDGKFATTTVRRGNPEKATLTDPTYFILIPAGDTWKVDVLASEQKASGPNALFP